jgi:hypothetical protein
LIISTVGRLAEFRPHERNLGKYRPRFAQQKVTAPSVSSADPVV